MCCPGDCGGGYSDEADFLGRTPTASPPRPRAGRSPNEAVADAAGTGLPGAGSNDVPLLVNGVGPLAVNGVVPLAVNVVADRWLV